MFTCYIYVYLLYICLLVSGGYYMIRVLEGDMSTCYIYVYLLYICLLVIYMFTCYIYVYLFQAVIT